MGNSYGISHLRKLRKWGLALLCAVSLLTVSVADAAAARVTDMAGRTVTVPGKIRKVWSAYPPLTYLLYTLAPELLNGWNSPLSERSRPFVDSRYRDLPVVGGWFGQRTPNFETLVQARPDVALVWDSSLRAMPAMGERLRKLSIPVVAIKLERLSDYPETILFLGRLLDRRARARQLADSITGTIREMRAFAASIPPRERKSVYYAIGPDGLGNDCEHMPFLEESIELAGGRSAHHCARRKTLSNKISLELVMAYNPDVIITQDNHFFGKVLSDRRWQGIRAVKERRVYRIPSLPFNWLNYPPSFMRALGVRWLASVIYPERRKQNLERDVRNFYRQFLNLELNQRQIEAILAN
ncbi:MAG: ABC transporter substrate-binding protein [Geobacteraceae bacterium]|nr:ABC transporter substrate-binding protein [Geobacteraceae bacterium]